MQDPDNKQKSYTYKRFMRDGSVQEITAVVRSRASKNKKEKKHGKRDDGTA